MTILVILLGIVLGLLSIFIGSNIDRNWNIFKTLRCSKCGNDLQHIKCECGRNNFILYFFIVLAAAEFTYIGWIFLNAEFYIVLVFIVLMLSVTVSDIIEQIVPDRLIVIVLPVILLMRVFIPTDPWFISYLGGLVAFGFFYLMAFIGDKFFNKEVIGGGDIKLYAIIGLVLGLELTMLSIFIASALGWIFIKAFGRLVKNEYIPFVPFITIGSFVSLYYGDVILNWYFGLF